MYLYDYEARLRFGREHGERLLEAAQRPLRLEWNVRWPERKRPERAVRHGFHVHVPRFHLHVPAH